MSSAVARPSWAARACQACSRGGLLRGLAGGVGLGGLRGAGLGGLVGDPLGLGGVRGPTGVRAGRLLDLGQGLGRLDRCGLGAGPSDVCLVGQPGVLRRGLVGSGPGLVGHPRQLLGLGARLVGDARQLGVLRGQRLRAGSGGLRPLRLLGPRAGRLVGIVLRGGSPARELAVLAGRFLGLGAGGVRGLGGHPGLLGDVLGQRQRVVGVRLGAGDRRPGALLGLGDHDPCGLLRRGDQVAGALLCREAGLMRCLGVLGVPGRRLIGDLPGLGVLGGRPLGLPAQLGLLAGRRLGALPRQGRDLGLLERLGADGLQLLGQGGQPGLGRTPVAVRLGGAHGVLAGLLVRLHSTCQGGFGRLVLDSGLLLGLGAGGVRLDRVLGLLSGGVLGGVPRAGLGVGLLLDVGALQRGGLGGPGLLERGLLCELALAAAGEGCFLGDPAALAQLGGGVLRDGPGLVRLLGRGSVPGGQLLGSLPGLVGALRGLLRGQPLGGLQGGRLLGDPAQPGRLLGGAGVLKQPRLHRLDIGHLGALGLVGVRSFGKLVVWGDRRGRLGVGRSSHCRECSCGAAVKRLAEEADFRPG